MVNPNPGVCNLRTPFFLLYTHSLKRKTALSNPYICPCHYHPSLLEAPWVSSLERVVPLADTLVLSFFAPRYWRVKKTLKLRRSITYKLLDRLMWTICRNFLQCDFTKEWGLEDYLNFVRGGQTVGFADSVSRLILFRLRKALKRFI